MSRGEGDVTRSFVAIASTLANGEDVVDLFSTLTADCAQLLDDDFLHTIKGCHWFCTYSCLILGRGKGEPSRKAFLLYQTVMPPSTVSVWPVM